MESKVIFEHIKRIAEEQRKEKSTLTRADLAFELKPYGINGDSFEINKLVFDAYMHYNENAAIKNAFVEMDSNESIVSSYQLHDSIDKADFLGIQKIMQGRLDETSQSLTNLNEDILENLSDAVIKVAADTMHVVSGNSAVVKIQKESGILFGKYTEMVNSYEAAKTEIKILTKDFAYLRDEIMAVYRKYATELIDIFGDSIKSVEPELFDFEAIEWMNVQNMLKNTQLEYSKLSESCFVLMSSISEKFNTTLQNSVNQYKSVGYKGVGLALTGLNLLNHYVNARAKGAELKIELERFKNNIHKDGTVIKTDLMRLMSIYKSMNDVNIPKANAFYRFSENILSREFDNLVNSLYSTPELKNLKEERDRIFSDYKSLENLVVDHQMNVDNYTVIIEDNKQLISNLTDDYNTAINTKPSKPSALINFFSLGSKNKSFNRDMYEWQQQYTHTIETYQNLQIDLKLYQEDMDFHKKALKNIENDYAALKKQLEEVNAKIRKALSVSNETKIKVSESLTDIVGLLRLAREIANTNLMAQQMKVVKAPELKEITIPENIQNGIASLTSMLNAGLTAKAEEITKDMLDVHGELQELRNQKIQKAIEAREDENSITALQASDLTVCEADIMMLGDQTSQIVGGFSNLFQAYSNLVAMKETSAIALEQYDAKMSNLQEQFKQMINSADNKSAILRETLKSINLSQSPNELKKALLSLSDGEISLSEEDIDNFLSGNKKIEL